MHSPRKKNTSLSLSLVCVCLDRLCPRKLSRKSAHTMRASEGRDLPPGRRLRTPCPFRSRSVGALRAFEKDHHRKTTFEKRGVLNRLSRLGERFENADDDEARRRRQSRRQSRLTFFALLLDAGAVGAGRGGISVFARSLRIKSQIRSSFRSRFF